MQQRAAIGSDRNTIKVAADGLLSVHVAVVTTAFVICLVTVSVVAIIMNVTLTTVAVINVLNNALGINSEGCSNFPLTLKQPLARTLVTRLM
jgi:hypothetical protein